MIHPLLVPFDEGALSQTHTWTANQTYADDILLRMGSDGDVALVLKSAVLAADEEITNVIIGTSDHQGAAANSWILSNITADGDILGLVNNGGNSLEWLRVDASAKDISLGFGLGSEGSFSLFRAVNASYQVIFGGTFTPAAA